MKKFTHTVLTALLVLSAQTALAHDPAEHAKEAAAKTGPDCAAMQNMDMATMDMKDPVMQAMHRQCMKPMENDSINHDTKMTQMQKKTARDTGNPGKSSDMPVQTGMPDQHKHGSH